MKHKKIPPVPTNSLAYKMKHMTTKEKEVYRIIADAPYADKVTSDYIYQGLGYNPNDYLKALSIQKLIRVIDGSYELW